MPIGIQRLNALKTQPSSQVVFIKPLPGPDSAYAQDFLERIAAICHPIMKANHLSIMTLEEHEPNPEFIGRNFNAGEIIQLVLKAPYSGHWLSFRSVQMVMVHELAHCQQMNHGRQFWKVNGQFKGELKELWAKNYTGDGLWGRGQTLLSGQYDTGRDTANEIMPANLCGGTFRSRRRKRKRGGNAAVGTRKETYAEARQRRIAKKFGVEGKILGGDEETRVKLDYGQKVIGNPRVANSARGRELRVAAAAARFGQQKIEEEKAEEIKSKEDRDDHSEIEDDYEDREDGETAIDLNGSELLDGHGQSMVRVCADEDPDDIHVKEEMDELHELNSSRAEKSMREESPNRAIRLDTASCNTQKATPNNTNSNAMDRSPTLTLPPPIASPTPASADASNATNAPPPNVEPAYDSKLTCPICSMFNESSSLLCVACSHVLDTSKVREYWRCHSEVCKDSQYVNTADSGICGICGARKPGSLNGG